MDENNTGNQLTIYPNPTDGKITMILPSKKAFTGDLTISDASGAAVYTKNSISILSGVLENIDLGSLSEGVYSVKLSSSSTVYFGRVIVK
jgi:hypothetical protein